jgi:lysine 2,3-aminomutase
MKETGETLMDSGDASPAHGTHPWQRFPRWRDVGPELWHDWRWQARNLLRRIDDLDQVVPLRDAERRKLASIAADFHFAMTPYYAALIDPDDPHDPIRRQSVPAREEGHFYGHEAEDPLAEEETSPVPGLTHRYPDRALLVTTNYCYMYCRHCTRKRIWKNGEGAAPRETILAMVDYLRGRPEVRDAIVSGGDPLSLPLEQLDFILGQLRTVPHLEIIRIGTRVPVVLPMRVTPELVAVLAKHGPIWLNTQFNHPREVTAEAAAAVDRLLRAGVPVNNQTVLLRGVNDSTRTMLALNHALLRAKVRPYYLFQCDPVVGAEHFRTPVETGLKIMGEMRGFTSGLALPTYVIDLPGGGGKVPVSPNYVIGESERGLVLHNFEGKTYTYPTPVRTARRVAARRRVEQLDPVVA